MKLLFLNNKYLTDTDYKNSLRPSLLKIKSNGLCFDAHHEAFMNADHPPEVSAILTRFEQIEANPPARSEDDVGCC